MHFPKHFPTLIYQSGDSGWDKETQNENGSTEVVLFLQCNHLSGDSLLTDLDFLIASFLYKIPGIYRYLIKKFKNIFSKMQVCSRVKIQYCLTQSRVIQPSIINKYCSSIQIRKNTFSFSYMAVGMWLRIPQKLREKTRFFN